MNITGKYLKVWKVEEKSGYKFLDIGDSRKNKAGEYENCTWFGCMCLGEAAKVDVIKDDKIEITSAQIFMEKYKDKWSPKIKIFGFQVMGASQQQQGTNLDNKSPEDFEDDIPY